MFKSTYSFSFMFFISFGERGGKLLTGEENRDAKLPCCVGTVVVATGSASAGSEVWLMVGKVGAAAGVRAVGEL